jgi:fibrillarin-like rRNA methylase
MRAPPETPRPGTWVAAATTAAELADAIRSGQVYSQEVVEAHMRWIEQLVQASQPRLAWTGSAGP